MNVDFEALKPGVPVRDLVYGVLKIVRPREEINDAKKLGRDLNLYSYELTDLLNDIELGIGFQLARLDLIRSVGDLVRAAETALVERKRPAIYS